MVRLLQDVEKYKLRSQLWRLYCNRHNICYTPETKPIKSFTIQWAKLQSPDPVQIREAQKVLGII